MIKGLNRNHLKIIALVTMLIGHIGLAFFDDIIWLRIIGRISFPIFAFFIAEGYRHTKNRKKYVLLLFVFALISQTPYWLFLRIFALNTIFTFLISVFIIYLIENFKNNIFFSLYFLITNLFVLFMFAINLISYGFFGVYIAVAFYFIKKTNLKMLSFIALNIFISLPQIISFPNVFVSYIQLFAILAIPLFWLYNGKKGKQNLKYLFYIFYPSHMLLLVLIKLLI